MDTHTLKILFLYDKTISQLDIFKLNIYGILDLNEYKHLTKLKCSDNKITQIINLPKYLTSIDCSNNQIKKISDLPTKLIHLEFDYSNRYSNSLEDLPIHLEYLILPKDLKYPIENLSTQLIHLTYLIQLIYHI